MHSQFQSTTDIAATNDFKDIYLPARATFHGTIAGLLALFCAGCQRQAAALPTATLAVNHNAPLEASIRKPSILLAALSSSANSPAPIYDTVQHLHFGDRVIPVYSLVARSAADGASYPKGAVTYPPIFMPISFVPTGEPVYVTDISNTDDGFSRAETANCMFNMRFAITIPALTLCAQGKVSSDVFQRNEQELEGALKNTPQTILTFANNKSPNEKTFVKFPLTRIVGELIDQLGTHVGEIEFIGSPDRDPINGILKVTKEAAIEIKNNKGLVGYQAVFQAFYSGTEFDTARVSLELVNSIISASQKQLSSSQSAGGAPVFLCSEGQLAGIIKDQIKMHVDADSERTLALVLKATDLPVALIPHCFKRAALIQGAQLEERLRDAQFHRQLAQLISQPLVDRDTDKQYHMKLVKINHLNDNEKATTNSHTISASLEAGVAIELFSASSGAGASSTISETDRQRIMRQLEEKFGLHTESTKETNILKVVGVKGVEANNESLEQNLSADIIARIKTGTGQAALPPIVVSFPSREQVIENRAVYWPASAIGRSVAEHLFELASSSFLQHHENSIVGLNSAVLNGLQDELGAVLDPSIVIAALQNHSQASTFEISIINASNPALRIAITAPVSHSPQRVLQLPFYGDSNLHDGMPPPEALDPRLSLIEGLIGLGLNELGSLCRKAIDSHNPLDRVELTQQIANCWDSLSERLKQKATAVLEQISLQVAYLEQLAAWPEIAGGK